MLSSTLLAVIMQLSTCSTSDTGYIYLTSEHRNFTLEDVHVEGAERIAEAVAKYDVDRFIHVSSHSANKNSTSEFLRTKVCYSAFSKRIWAELEPQAQGEEVVRSIFPEATIVRPGPLFGFEDRLLHKLAGRTNVFTSNHMKQRFWPVHVNTSPYLTLINLLNFLHR